MAAGSFVSEDIDQQRKCAQDILTMLSENGDADKASKEITHFASEIEKAENLEKRWLKTRNTILPYLFFAVHISSEQVHAPGS